MTDFYVQNWQQAYDETYYLFEKIRNSGYQPDIVVGIARGGWIPARLLADFFSLKQTANIKVEAYQLIGEIDVEPKITQDINAPVTGKNVLIVDDIADSGSSLDAVIRKMQDEGVKEMKTATLYYKSRSIIHPDYYVGETDAWVIFPWEIYETIHEFIGMWTAEGMTQSEIIEKCKSIGLPAGMVNSYFASN
jgi:hypoxanthine phosphoribosyltransferase